VPARACSRPQVKLFGDTCLDAQVSAVVLFVCQSVRTVHLRMATDILVTLWNKDSGLRAVAK
jgi:hypothetical protein